MRKIKFLTDTASDLPGQYKETHNIDMIPISIVVDDEEYENDQNDNLKGFYTILRNAKDVPKTAQITAYTFMQYYKKYYDEGYTHIVGLFLPEFASGTYQNALLAKAQFEEEYPEAADFTIFITDSKTYSLGYGLCLVEASNRVQQGATFEEVVAFIEDWVSRIEIYFSMYTLEFARKSGRLGTAAALIGNILGIKPIMCVKQGKLSVYKKTRGSKTVIRELCKIVEERMAKDSIYAVLQGDTEEEANRLYDSISENCAYESYKPCYSGPAVTINSGPDIVGVGFLGEKS